MYEFSFGVVLTLFWNTVHC